MHQSSRVSRRFSYLAGVTVTLGIAAFTFSRSAKATYCYSDWSAQQTGGSDAANVSLFHVLSDHTNQLWLQSCTQADPANSSAGIWVSYYENEGAPAGQYGQFQGRAYLQCTNESSPRYSSWHVDDTANDGNHPEELIGCGTGHHPQYSRAQAWTGYFATCPVRSLPTGTPGNYWEYNALVGLCPSGFAL